MSDSQLRKRSGKTNRSDKIPYKPFGSAKPKKSSTKKLLNNNLEIITSAFQNIPFGNLLKTLIYGSLALCLAAILAIIFIRSPIEALEYTLPDPPEWIGPLAINTKLQNAELLFHNNISGPESMLISEHGIIASAYDGKIIHIKNDKFVREIHLGKAPCGTYADEPTCGRPLGIKWYRYLEKTVVVADAYLGLYLVDIESGKFDRIVPGGLAVEGRPLTFLNDVEVLPNGTILFTDSSSKWERRNFLFSLLEGSGDGRLLSFCPETKKIRVLIDDLHFPNGVQIAKDQNYVLISELAKARVLKYHLAGPKVGTHEVFVDNLPGFPDNIRIAANGNYWIGMSAIRRLGSFSLIDKLGPYPSIRNILAKIIPAKRAHNLMQFLPCYGLIVQVDPEGRYVSSLHDPTGRRVPSVSEVNERGSSLYLGSYHSKFIAKVELS